jgi:glucosamine--fructose-6-phosphate aminotransferase (isomerizing)
MGEYTLPEILSQPETWKSVLNSIPHLEKEFLSFCKKKSCNNSVFIGCGTSFYLALSAANVFAEITHNNTRAVTASDILFYPEPIFTQKNQDYISFLISRSGTTTEALHAAEQIKKDFGFPTYGISCRPGSKLIHLCDYSIILPDADEKSVVMTRSFTSMLLMIELMAAIESGNDRYQNELLQLPEKGKEIINTYHQLIKEISTHKLINFIYLGQGPYYGLACESMLKIKEMSLSASEAYHSLEFRHGPMSRADNQMLITFFISDKAEKDELMLLKEMKQLGAKTLVICEKANDKVYSISDFLVELKSGLSDFARLILYMPITQLLGYYTAKGKGLDPDNPKNLSQVVEIK